MINKIFDIPSFSLFNNYEIINKLKYKVNEIIDKINEEPAPVPAGYEVIYSSDERKIGSYFGEDLYEKTFSIPNWDSEQTTYPISFNAKKIVAFDGYIADTTGVYYKIPVSTPSSNFTNSYWLRPEIFNSESESDPVCYLDIRRRNGTVEFPDTDVNGFVKIQYTKY